MNANKAGLLLATLVFICFASVASSQPAVDPLLAKLNALPPDERHAALVKGARTERVVEWYATLPVEHSKVLIEAFRQRYPFIEVNYTGAGGGRMVNRVVTEHRAGQQVRRTRWNKYFTRRFDESRFDRAQCDACAQRTPGWIYGCRGLSGCALHVCLGDWI